MQVASDSGTTPSASTGTSPSHRSSTCLSLREGSMWPATASSHMDRLCVVASVNMVSRIMKKALERKKKRTSSMAEAMKMKPTAALAVTSTTSAPCTGAWQWVGGGRRAGGQQVRGRWCSVDVMWGDAAWRWWWSQVRWACCCGDDDACLLCYLKIAHTRHYRGTAGAALGTAMLLTMHISHTQQAVGPAVLIASHSSHRLRTSLAPPCTHS